MKTHKMNLIKGKTGYNPFQPLCESSDAVNYIAEEWDEVDCKECHRIKRLNQGIKKELQDHAHEAKAE